MYLNFTQDEEHAWGKVHNPSILEILFEKELSQGFPPEHRFTPSYKGDQRRQWQPTPVLLPGKSPWMEEPDRLQAMGLLRVGQNWASSLSCIGEGNGNPLQCSCLENPRDGGASWAAIYGATQSRTRLKWLSSSTSSSIKETEISNFIEKSIVINYQHAGKMLKNLFGHK